MADRTKSFTVTVVTPFGTQEEFNVTHLRAPGSEGDFGVLPGHLPFMTMLRIGRLTLDTTDGLVNWATSGGYAEVLGDKVTILAETAERSDRIDPERAKESQRRALERLSEKAGDVDIERARIALARALNRIAVGSHTTSN